MRLTRTLQDDGVHGVAIMQWLLPSAEFSGGWALIVGFLSVLAAFGLFAICFGALAFDAVKRIRSWQPIDRADWLGAPALRPRSALLHWADRGDTGRSGTVER